MPLTAQITRWWETDPIRDAAWYRDRDIQVLELFTEAPVRFRTAAKELDGRTIALYSLIKDGALLGDHPRARLCNQAYDLTPAGEELLKRLWRERDSAGA